MQKVLFDIKAKGWKDASTLPKDIRAVLIKKMPWISLEEKLILESFARDTFKAAVQGQDGLLFETVLMKNRREQWTI